MRTKFKRITQGDGPLKDYVADFRNKRDEASAAGATIADEAARDMFVEGLTTVSIKQELWKKLTVDAMEMTCAQVIDRALRLDANIAMERTPLARTRSSNQRPIPEAQPSTRSPRPPGACFECGSTAHMARDCPHRSSAGSWRAPAARPPRQPAPPPAVQAHAAAVHTPATPTQALPPPPQPTLPGQAPPWGKPLGRLTEEMRDRIDAEGGCKWCQQVYSVCGHIRKHCPYAEPYQKWQGNGPPQ